MQNSGPRASQIEIVRLTELRPPRRNARTHSKKQIRQIADSILQFGWTYPILIDENKQIIAGVGRFKAADQLGLPSVPVIFITGLSDAKKRALALADNKIAANAGWDRAVLAAELGELANLLPECALNIDITALNRPRSTP
jgi:ParB-like chromosome segregation protein Spo0J